MTLTQTHARFMDTSQTLIHALHDQNLAADAAEEITRMYWPPVYAYLRHGGMNRDQAAELTQSFFAEKVFGRQLFEKAQPDRGRVRNLVLSALKNFLIDQHRKEVVRGKGHHIPLELFDSEEPSQQQDPDDAFNTRWASAQLEESIHRCEAHFRSTGRSAHWEAFADRIYHPTIHNTTPTPLNVLAPKLGFSTPAKAAAAVQLVKRRSISFLHEIVIESSNPGLESEAEYTRILDFLQISRT